MRRRAGILVPLFSIPSARSWGIGEIGDIPVLAAWLRAAGQRILQMLPINEMPPAERSPYSALSAMAIDPQFISLGHVEDFAALGGEEGLEPELRRRLDDARAARTVDYDAVRALKQIVLRRSFVRFKDVEWNTKSSRSVALREYIGAEADWLDDYALFRALHAAHGEKPWLEWPAPFRRRDPAALAEARETLADAILYRQYLQWIAQEQWRAARASAHGVALFGDLPFMVSGDSADVWTRQDEFRLDSSIGVPPDAFSKTGQDWGMPVYRWDVFAERDFEWLRVRAQRNALLFDGYRVDHLVGFYRTYFRSLDGGEAQFTPVEEEAQIELGERVLEVLREPGAEITAEDLGVVPEFVRDSLARLDIPGYKVLRWERHWDTEEKPFKDPVEYPARSVATSGTHDTEPMAVWWENAPEEEQEAVRAIPSVRERLVEDHQIRDALIEVLVASGSNLLILPIQDVFGWSDRINQPATVGDDNWTWRLPWTVDRMLREPEAVKAASRLREWTQRYRRTDK